MSLTLKDYRQHFSYDELQVELINAKELESYWLKSMSSYDDKENGHYDGYNYNRCRNEALKFATTIKRINKVITEKLNG